MNVKFFATYRMIVGQGCINLPAPRDVLELLEILEQRYPDFQGLLLNDDHTDKGRDAIVLLRGRHAGYAACLQLYPREGASLPG